jgi:hypothetical protein
MDGLRTAETSSARIPAVATISPMVIRVISKSMPNRVKETSGSG